MYAVALSDPPQCNIHRAASDGRALGARKPKPAFTPDARVMRTPSGVEDQAEAAAGSSEPSYLRIVPGELSAKRKPGPRPGSSTKQAPDLTRISDKTLSGMRDEDGDDVLEKLRQMVPQALARLRAIITDDSGAIKPETQMRAAEAVLDRFAAKRVQTEVRTVAGERRLDEELAPLVAEIRRRTG